MRIQTKVKKVFLYSNKGKLFPSDLQVRLVFKVKDSLYFIDFFHECPGSEELSLIETFLTLLKFKLGTFSHCFIIPDSI